MVRRGGVWLEVSGNIWPCARDCRGGHGSSGKRGEASRRQASSNHDTFQIRTNMIILLWRFSEVTPHSSIHTPSKVFNIATIQPCHRDPSIHRKIYVRLFRQRLALFRFQPGEPVMVFYQLTAFKVADAKRLTRTSQSDS